MNRDNWHEDFNPSKFIARVELDRFLDKNGVDPDHIRDQIAPCVLCQSTAGPGLLLNNGSYICEACFKSLSTTSFPEKYESRWRKFLASYEAWRLARNAYIESRNKQMEQDVAEWTEERQAYDHRSPWTRLGPLFGIVTLASLFSTVIVHGIGFVFGLGAGVVSVFCYSRDSRRRQNWERRNPRPVIGRLHQSKPIPDWDKRNQEPSQPNLRHFHDPRAVLSGRDRAVLDVFNHWPGYPPYWDYLRKVVRERDGNRCQVSGCPSRVDKHVHHMMPTSKGGGHTPDNLVCLCAFHHGLEPEVGHERVWGDIKNRYFTLVRAHQRKNPGGKGHHLVCAHVRRLELIDADELNAIADYYGFRCPSCASSNLVYSVRMSEGVVDVKCPECRSSWTAKRALAEETGPRLAEVLAVSKNNGKWRANWDMFAARNHAVFKSGRIRKHRLGSILKRDDNSTRKGARKKRPDTPAEGRRRVVAGINDGRATELAADGVELAYRRGWMNEWEYRFYTDTTGKHRLTARQRSKRRQITAKVIRRSKSD